VGITSKTLAIETAERYARIAHEAGVQTVVVGGALRVIDTARNRGLAAAPKSIVGYYLSRDRMRSSGDRRLGRRSIGSLPPGRSSKGSRSVLIPASAAPGRYRLLACADYTHRVRETLETNNCRATVRALTVTEPPGDHTPPVFAGLQRATTCLPGPSGTGRKSSYHLGWSAATDDTTPGSEIVYDVYQATSAGGQTFSRPTYTTPAGADTFSTPPLPEEDVYYFVVRARDAAGNRDANRAERAGVNLCL